MKYIVANWKAHFNTTEMHNWLHTFSGLPLNKCGQNVEIILCPPLPFLSLVSDALYDPMIKVGVQNVSHFEQGTHTGEVTADMLDGVVDYAIIGHSERRLEYHETNEMIEKKCESALNAHIQPILCIRGKDDVIFEHVHFVAYEPIEAIGSGNNMSIEEVIAVKKTLNLSPDQNFIYGGSVKAENASEYLLSDEIDGVLVGGSTLDPHELFAIALSART